MASLYLEHDEGSDAMQQEMFSIDNPCIQVCEMDHKGYCKGCLRNRTERELWYNMTDSQKRQVLHLIYMRRVKRQRAPLKTIKNHSEKLDNNLSLFDV